MLELRGNARKHKDRYLENGAFPHFGTTTIVFSILKIACVLSFIKIWRCAFSLQQPKSEITVMDPNCFVGLQITRDRPNKIIHISQGHYVKKILERFELQDAKSESTTMDATQKLFSDGLKGQEDPMTPEVPYREAIGSLMYASVGSRPDKAFAVGFLSRFSDNPKKAHW